MAKNNKTLELIYSQTPYGSVPVAVKSKVRQRIKNVSVLGGGSGGMGDRGRDSSIALFSSNPLTFQDYVQKYRQFVALYKQSWECRKIVRIPVEDQLRKPWVAEGIPEEMATAIQTRFDQLQFLPVLKKSLILERLLGGCLTFMGLDAEQDDPEIPYNPREGKRLHFVNAIPPSRVTRAEWDTNPLSEHYMRPNKYMVNGTYVHSSRTLVWDGEPDFDPNDFMLQPYYANLAGFGDSKIGPLWDDIIRAVGTRQAAYSLILVNNSLIAAVSDLQDLAGTVTGKTKISKIREIANTMSLYRAAIVDGDKVDIKQHSASFGSVPELLMSYLQVLSAGADIPATRFLSSAPGGLSTDDRSGLENYYNSIDAAQHQRIEPQLRRGYDVVGYNLYQDQWDKARKDLRITFPPLWNLSELEEADRRTKLLANIVTALQERMMSEEHAIAEINASKIFTTKLDDTDLSVLESAAEEMPEMGDPGSEGPADPGKGNGAAKEIDKLRNTKFWNGADFKESEHPRDEDGKFGEGGSSRLSPMPDYLSKANVKVPPAWGDVRYNSNPKGPWWVRGKDSKGRLVEIRNPEADSKAQKAKFARVKEMERKFKSIQSQVEKDMSVPKLKEQAECLRLIIDTGIRPGSDSDTKAKVKAYGATTLEGRHVVEKDSGVRLDFVGKKGVHISIAVNDPGVAKFLLARKKSAGDNSKLFGTDYGKLLAYSHSLDGGKFKTKDFRTHLATKLAAEKVSSGTVPKDEKEYKKAVMSIAKEVASKLGNTATVALQRYINPSVFFNWQSAIK